MLFVAPGMGTPPLAHWKVIGPVPPMTIALSSELPPQQKLAEVIGTATGVETTTIVSTGVYAVDPSDVVTFALYIPPDATRKVKLLAPDIATPLSYHWKVSPSITPVMVNVVLPPAQKTLGLGLNIPGTGGNGFTVTVNTAEVALHPVMLFVSV